MKSFSYILSFIEGFLTFISPCILPLLPVYLFYLAGGASDNNEYTTALNKKRLIINSIAFVSGFTIIFIILGATATSLGSFFKGNIGIFQKISALVMIIFGLNFMGVFSIGFLNFEKRVDFKFKKLGLLNSIVFGIIFAFGWTPCGGQFLGAALLAAANKDTVIQGILLLLTYSLGLGIPFIIVAFIFEKIKGALRVIQKYGKAINIISGIVLIAAGILVFTGNLQYLSYYLTR